MGKIIKLHNVNKQDTPLFINGRGVNVPHNIDFPLADNFVELLSNSNANFSIQGEIPDAQCAGFDGPVGAEAGTGGSDASAPESSEDNLSAPALASDDDLALAPPTSEADEPLVGEQAEPSFDEPVPSEEAPPLVEGETPDIQPFEG